MPLAAVTAARLALDTIIAALPYVSGSVVFPSMKLQTYAPVHTAEEPPFPRCIASHPTVESARFKKSTSFWKLQLKQKRCCSVGQIASQSASCLTTLPPSQPESHPEGHMHYAGWLYGTMRVRSGLQTGSHKHCGQRAILLCPESCKHEC